MKTYKAITINGEPKLEPENPFNKHSYPEWDISRSWQEFAAANPPIEYIGPAIPDGTILDEGEVEISDEVYDPYDFIWVKITYPDTPEGLKNLGASTRRVATRKSKESEHTDKGLKEFINETAQSEQFKIPSSNMETFSNKLTDAQIERLAILLEECGEVQQMIGKIIRHGYESYNPFDPQKTTNRRLLQKEVGDLLLAVELLTKSDDLDVTQIAWSNIDKREKIKPYLHHQNQQQ